MNNMENAVPPTEAKIAYMCGTDFELSLVTEKKSPTNIFSTVEAIKHHKNCTHECGIVEVDVTLRRWVSPQNLELDD